MEVSAAPELKSLIYDRMIAEDVLDAFHMTAQGERWIYETRLMDGGTCKRGKAFNSASTPKYTWVPEKAPGALYFYPPSRSLSEAIKADNGLLYMAGGDIGTMSLMSAGLWNATNTFGDSSIPATLAADMQKLGVKRLVLLPDRDTSGQRWACKIRDLMIPVGLDIELEAKVLPFPLQDSHGMDVNDWWINLCDTTPSDEDEKAILREQITTLKEWKLPEPERKSTDVPDAVLGPLELPQDFITAITNALDTEPRYNGTGWTRKPVRCPFHDDAHPSAFWNAHMAILRCHSACGKSYLAKEVGEKLGIHLRDYLDATPRIPITKMTAGGTTITAVPKMEAPAPVAQDRAEALQMPAGSLRPPLPKEATLNEGDLIEAARGKAWLGDYVRWAQKAAPLSPASFHEAMGLWLLAAVSTRRVKLSVGGEDIYPNLYVLIVAKTSLYRKTTAMKQVRRLMEAAGMDALRLPEDATPEALFDELSGIKPSNYDNLTDTQKAEWLKGRAVCAQRAFIKDEASSVFADLRKEYKAGLAELLLQGYDGDGGRIQKLLRGRGLITLKDVCLSFLGATTPVMMARYMTNEEVENGFMARFAIVTPEGPPVYTMASDPVGVPAALSDRLRAIFMDVLPWHGGNRPTAASAFGDAITPPVANAQVNPVAMQRLHAYRKALGFDLIAQEVVSEDKAASYTRLGTMAIKVSLLLAMSETQPGSPITISEANALAAILICERWRESLHRMERDANRAVGNKTEDKLLEYLRSAGEGGATMRDIKRDVRMRDQREGADALTSLSDAGLIIKFERKAARGPKATAFRIAGIGDQP
jgi:hypothetical protein